MERFVKCGRVDGEWWVWRETGGKINFARRCRALSRLLVIL